MLSLLVDIGCPAHFTRTYWYTDKDGKIETKRETNFLLEASHCLFPFRLLPCPYLPWRVSALRPTWILISLTSPSATAAAEAAARRMAQTPERADNGGGGEGDLLLLLPLPPCPK